MLKVYVIGKYRDPDILNLFGNIRRGIVVAARLTQLGFAVFCPFLDFLYLLVLPAQYCKDIGVDKLQAQGMCWLEICDAVYVIMDGIESSEGGQAEIKRAEELGIPVFNSLVDLWRWKCEKSGIPINHTIKEA
jgi:hypothetical protein